MYSIKKVCILTSVHSAFDTRIFHKEARTLVRAGYDVTLIAQHNKNEIVDGIKIIALLRPKNRFYRVFFLTRKVYKIALKQNADIYHFHDPELIPPGIWLKFLGKKVIYDVHEDVPKQILSKHWLLEIIRKPISICVNCFEKLISLSFNYIITATPTIKANFRQYNVIDIRNYPILNSEILKNKSRGLIYQARGSDESDPYKVRSKDSYNLIYVGGLDKIRGIKEIIQVTELVNPEYRVKLLLAGRFSEKNFEEECHNLKGWKKTESLGWIRYEEIFNYLLNANIGLVCLYPLTRFLSSLPVKLFEYMSAKLPIIASNFPLWKEIIEGNNCGICVNPLKPEEIANAIEYLIQHPEEAKKMGENGRKAVIEKYNWENEEKKLLKVYKGLT